MASHPDTKDTEIPSAGIISTFLNVISHIFTPLNLLIIAIVLAIVYKVFKNKFVETPLETALELPKIRKDMTVAELRHYDGKQADGRVLVAVNGWIFDVTKGGRRFYGPEGRYAELGGKDASRGLATFSVTCSDKEYDDLSDLNSMEMESVKEWEAQFREKYYLVGKLLKPGEEPTNYSDEEPEDTDNSTNTSIEKKNK